MRIISFNANGLRSAASKGFFDWFAARDVDVLCLQETKAQEHQLSDAVFRPAGYKAWFKDASTKKGYSGVAIYSRREPDEVRTSLGWAPFDDEGVLTHKRKIVKSGVVQSYFLSSYSARKLGMRTTGHAGGSQNLIMSSKLTDPKDNLKAMLKKLGTGLFVTELMGQGVNYVTGDYSRGASGFWVENG